MQEYFGVISRVYFPVMFAISHQQAITHVLTSKSYHICSYQIPSARSKVATDAINAFLIMFARNRSLLEGEQQQNMFNKNMNIN